MMQRLGLSGQHPWLGRRACMMLRARHTTALLLCRPRAKTSRHRHLSMSSSDSPLRPVQLQLRLRLRPASRSLGSARRRRPIRGPSGQRLPSALESDTVYCTELGRQKLDICTGIFVTVHCAIPTNANGQAVDLPSHVSDQPSVMRRIKDRKNRRRVAAPWRSKK